MHILTYFNKVSQMQCQYGEVFASKFAFVVLVITAQAFLWLALTYESNIIQNWELCWSFWQYLSNKILYDMKASEMLNY